MKWFLLSMSLFFCNPATWSQKKQVLNHQVKLGFSSIFRGDFLCGYELMFAKKWSTELDMGFLTRDYSENFFYEISNSIEGVSMPGLSIAPSIRYYPYSPLTEFFIVTEFKYRNYRFVTNDIVTGRQVYSESKSTPRVGMGYMYYFDEHLKLDLSTNVGFTFIQSSIDQVDPNGPTTNKFHFGLNIKFAYSL